MLAVPDCTCPPLGKPLTAAGHAAAVHCNTACVGGEVG